MTDQTDQSEADEYEENDDEFEYDELQDATDDYERELTDSQELALAALMTGRTHREAATAAGVHRVTVTNWHNEDPVFAAEHNRRKAELREGVAAQLLNLTQKSLESIAASVETEQAEGGSVIALRVLGLLDLRRFPVPKPGPTDPYDVEQKWQDDAEAESVDRLLWAPRLHPQDPYGNGKKGATGAERKSWPN